MQFQGQNIFILSLFFSYIYYFPTRFANIVSFFCNIIIDSVEKKDYINNRLDHGSQVGYSNSGRIPLLHKRKPRRHGTFEVFVYTLHDCYFH